MYGQPLRSSIDKVMRDWEQQLRLRHPNETLTLPLQSHLPEIINNVAAALDSENLSSLNIKVESLSFPKNSLPAILEEFSVLRKTLKSFLSQIQASPAAHKIVDEWIDEAMILAGHQAVASKEEASKRSDLERFAAIAAHDLRSPVATMSGYADLLKEEISNPTTVVSQSLDFISSASQRMLNLIERLLDYSRIGNDENRKSMVDLNDLLVSTTANLESLIEETQSQVSYFYLPKVYGDEALLGQLFQNLIANSIKFRSENPPLIQIALLEENKDQWIFSVTDNGIGFEPEQALSIFEPFKRLHSKKEYQGSGLGLSTCRRVVEIHGGRIWCESQPGQGARFFFTIAKSSTDTRA